MIGHFGIIRFKDEDGKQMKEMSLNVQEKGDCGKTWQWRS